MVSGILPGVHDTNGTSFVYQTEDAKLEPNVQQATLHDTTQTSSHMPQPNFAHGVDESFREN